MTGRILRQSLDGKREYILLEVARAEAGFDLMETYIRKRQNIAAQYIATRLLLNLCGEVEGKQGGQVGMQWWEQAVIELPGEK